MYEIIIFLLPLIFCGDEVTDILYLIDNWDSFANVHLKNSAVAFVLINGVLCGYVGLKVLGMFFKFGECNFGERCGIIWSCVWIPVLTILFLLFWCKLL